MNRKGVRIGPEPLFVFARIMQVTGERSRPIWKERENRARAGAPDRAL
jgi:hypothetical protein